MIVRKLYKFNREFGRMGSLSGIFAEEEEDVADAIGKVVDFGEALGKHSQIRFTLAAEDLTILTDDQAFIEKFEEFGCASGHDPLDSLNG